VLKTKKYIEQIKHITYETNTPHSTSHISYSKIQNLKSEIQNLMWQNVGIVREEKNMKETLEKLDKYETSIRQMINNGINKEILELKSLCTVAKLITEAAINRRQSIGTHFILN